MATTRFREHPAAARPAMLVAIAFLTLAVERGAAFIPSSGIADDRARADIAKAEALLSSVVDRGSVLFFLARRYIGLGERDRALELLRECLALDEGFDPSERAEFQPLAGDPRFEALARRARRRFPPVRRAQVAFTVRSKDMFPEGLAVDSDRHVFYLGSEYHKNTVAISRTGAVSEFVRSGLYDLPPVGGLRVDPMDHSVWAATDSSQLVHFDAGGALVGRFTATDPGPHILNDLVVGPADVYVTDTAGHRVYRVDRRTGGFAPVALHRDVLYPNGITFSEDGQLLLIADIFGVIALELGTGASRDIEPGPHNTLAGIDGLYWYRGGLVGVQYGTGAYRVMRWRLSPDTRRVTRTDWLEYRTGSVTFPTTGAIDRDRFYFIANAGLDNLRNDMIVNPARLEPVRIAVVAVHP